MLGVGRLASNEAEMSADGSSMSRDLTPYGAEHRVRLEDAYRKHWDGICRYIRARFGRGPPEPEDIAQAAFVKLAALPQPWKVDNAEAFLKTTARNLALDAHRHGGRTRVVLHEVHFRTVDDCDSAPEDVLDSREELRRLDAAIARLSPKQRVALMMHRIDGLSYVEIARRLGMSRSGAANLVATAFALCMSYMRRAKK